MDFKLISRIFSLKNLSLVLRCLMDRIPIIIGGTDKELVDKILIELCDMFPNRKELIFGTDFVMQQEYESIKNEEKLDYDNVRVIIRAPVSASDLLLSNGEEIHGWVIGLEKNGDLDCFYEKAYRIRKSSPSSLFIILEGEKVENMKFYGEKRPNTQFESRVLQRIMSTTESALERMQRVLNKKIQYDAGINDSIIRSLVDLEQEENIIKENIFKREMSDFYQAARRALAILTRLNFLNQFHPVKIGRKTFFDSISYSDISTKRMTDFIKAEWGEDFHHLIDERMVSVLGDHLDSLWG